MSQQAAEPLEAGREALERAAWQEAFEHLSNARDADGLSADDLVGLAQAAWWTGHLDDCIRARERAFTSYLEADDRRRAAIAAMDLAKDYYAKQVSSVGSAWVRRAERLLEGEGECLERGYLARLHGVIAFEGMSDFEGALADAERALASAERFGDRDLQAVAIHDRGRALVAKGEVAEGLSLLDESTVAALSGELAPMATGIIYCNMITTCEQLGDYRRAGHWSEAATRWCERQAITGFPGVCRVHRAEIMSLRGAWPEAEQEVRRACEELKDFNLEAAAEAFYELGELRLRVGDLPAAEKAFRQANELGREPQPGLGLLRLAEGKLEAALACIDRALSDTTSELARARLLPARAELLLAAGDLEGARAATEELEAIADKYGSAALAASAACTRGELQVKEGDPSAGVGSLRRGLRLWREINAPYEGAKARIWLARAYWAEGDTDSAALEASSARSAFEHLGAAPDERSAAELLSGWLGLDAGSTEPTGTRLTKTFVFTDIVKSTNLVEAIGDEAWDDLISWHDRTLRALFDRHQGHEVDHAGDGFFVAFDRPEEAVACAVEIQRTLAKHRRTSGFAPQVRIGVHGAEATRAGTDYRGRGVHEAARVAALAEGGQVLVSKSTFAGTPPPFALSSARNVSLKGMSEPVGVVTVDWS